MPTTIELVFILEREYAASLDRALQTVRAKLPASCRKPESY